MSNQNANANNVTLPDMTAEKPVNTQTLNVNDIRQAIQGLAGEATKAHDNRESLVAKLANIAAPYVQACEHGYTEIVVRPEKPEVKDKDGNVVQQAIPEYTEHVQHKPRPITDKDVAKFIKDSFGFKPEKLEGDTGDSVKSRISYKNTTVEQTAAISAKASILIARKLDGLTVAYFVGRRSVQIDANGKAPKGATLRLALPHNVAEPHLKFKGNPIVNPNKELIVAAPSQVSTSWQACIEGKKRDAYGKIVRGSVGGRVFDWSKAIGDLSKAMFDDAKDQTAPYGDIVTNRKALENLAGLIDSLLTKAQDEYPEEFEEKKVA